MSFPAFRLLSLLHFLFIVSNLKCFPFNFLFKLIFMARKKTEKKNRNLLYAAFNKTKRMTLLHPHGQRQWTNCIMNWRSAPSKTKKDAHKASYTKCAFIAVCIVCFPFFFLGYQLSVGRSCSLILLLFFFFQLILWKGLQHNRVADERRELNMFHQTEIMQ